MGPRALAPCNQFSSRDDRFGLIGFPILTKIVEGKPSLTGEPAKRPQGSRNLLFSQPGSARLQQPVQESHTGSLRSNTTPSMPLKNHAALQKHHPGFLEAITNGND